ncbi:MAG: hypothetical protein SV966_05815 [Actinomycetota bacterium]|nr:hypothetical protein [Actinomycetota bacterium]
MRRRLMLLTAMIVAAGLTAAPGGAVDSPVGHIGQPLRVQFNGLIADVTSAPPGSTVSGGVWWACYRDLLSNGVLVDKITGEHLAQWNL